VTGRTGFALGAAVLVVAIAAGVYLFLSERSSDQRVDSAAAGLELAGDQAALADEFQAAAGLAPSASGQARLEAVARRADALVQRARCPMTSTPA